MTPPSPHGLRSVADQDDRTRGGPGSILSRQSRDHAELHRLMRAYDAAPDPDERRRLVGRLAERSLRHAFAEETVLFPAYRTYLPDDGDSLTAHIEGEHQEINELLERLQDTDPRDPGWEPAVRRLFALVTDDARTEEDVLLPRLQQVADVRELRAIGAAWETARRTSPTRPHPGISRRPPGNLLAGGPLALSDRVKDAARHAPRTGVAVVLLGVLALVLRRRSAGR